MNSCFKISIPQRWKFNCFLNKFNSLTILNYNIQLYIIISLIKDYLRFEPEIYDFN